MLNSQLTDNNYAIVAWQTEAAFKTPGEAN